MIVDTKTKLLMEIKIIQKRIFEIRGVKVMLDLHLAELYEVETRVLKQAVRRNLDRFPDDFMFQLTTKEVEVMVSQSVIPSKSYFGGALPFAFTEQGVSMLATVLKSKKAVLVNISIIRAFVFLRQFAMDYKEVKEKIEKLEKDHNAKFEDIFKVLNYLLSPKAKRQQIGFKIAKKEEE